MTAAKRITVKVRRLPHADGLALPAYQSKDAAGLDLVAAIAKDAPVTLAPGARALIPTGLTLELPTGTEAQVRPRSGLAAKHGVTVLNSPGTIDADYRGEIAVILVNLGQAPFAVSRGDRIAQMVIASVTQARLVEARSLTMTKRGAGGFGSTGSSEHQGQAVAARKKNRIARKGTKAKPDSPKRVPGKAR